MVQLFQFGNLSSVVQEKGMKWFNCLLVFFGIGIVVVVVCVFVYGILFWGLWFGDRMLDEVGLNVLVLIFVDQMKCGVKDGIIGDCEEQFVFQFMFIIQINVEVKLIEEEQIKQQVWEEC